MLLQGGGEILPKPPCLIPVTLLFPQASVAMVIVHLPPAGAWQCDRREDNGDSCVLQGIQNTDQLLQVRSRKRVILVGGKQQEVAITPLLVGEPDKANIGAGRRFHPLSRYRAVEAVRASSLA